jgi:hypothetical protein
MHLKVRLASILAANVAMGVPLASSASENGDWQWMVEPYVWAASIGTDMRTFSPPTEAGSDSSFSDIIEKLDGVFMGRVEGRNERFGVFADFVYLGLADSNQHRLLGTSTDLDARLLDAAFSLRFGGEPDRGLDLYGGVRYIDLDLTTRFVPDNPAFSPRTLDAGNSYVDFLLGARYAWPLSERWNLTLRGDASAGDTDGTWSASIMTGYRTGNGAWLFGYRYMEADFGNRNTDITLDLAGPVIGYGFRF